MKKISFLILLLTAAVALRAEIIQGTVVDADGQPIAYATVFQNANPTAGVSSDQAGHFALDLHRDLGGELVVSFISYKTVEYDINKVSPGANIRVTLVEQPIMLDEAVVQAKLSRREAKKLKKTVLERFIERLRADFPKRRSVYEVVSSYSGTQNGRQLLRHEIVGTITETPGTKKDDIRLDVTAQKKFFSNEVVEGYEILDSISIKRTNTKKNVKKGKTYNGTPLDQNAIKVHRFLWGTQMYYLADQLDINKASRWQYTVVDGQAVLIYTQKLNYIIAKGVLTFTFYIDPVTCALNRMTQSLTGELNIPFGYKLKPDELEFVNALQLPEETMTKYRVRHVYGDVKRNIIYKTVGQRRQVSEKNLDVAVRFVGSKKETLSYSARAKAVVTK